MNKQNRSVPFLNGEAPRGIYLWGLRRLGRVRFFTRLHVCVFSSPALWGFASPESTYRAPMGATTNRRKGGRTKHARCVRPACGCGVSFASFLCPNQRKEGGATKRPSNSTSERKRNTFSTMLDKQPRLYIRGGGAVCRAFIPYHRYLQTNCGFSR